MDQSEQQQQQQQQQDNHFGYVPFQNASLVPSDPPAATIPSPTQPTNAAFPYQQQHFHHQQQQLQMFWADQMQDIEQTSDFKIHSLPLARIKKIMKADEDVRMISAEAPVVFAKACEMFILELTLRSWIHTEENKRRTLQKNDIAAAISRTDVFDFLVDIIPRDEMKEEGLGMAKGSVPDMPYYYMPPQHPMGPGGMMMGKPVVDQSAAAAMYSARPPPMAFMPWAQSQQPQQTQQNGGD